MSRSADDSPPAPRARRRAQSPQSPTIEFWNTTGSGAATAACNLTAIDENKSAEFDITDTNGRCNVVVAMWSNLPGAGPL
jgi:hypothetical protein